MGKVGNRLFTGHTHLGAAECLELGQSVQNRSIKNMSSPEALYVIGNGFDLWHGIPSKYSDFRDFVRLNDTTLFDRMEDYLPMEEDWSDLEAALADLDVDFLLENNECFLVPYGADDWSDSGHHDFQYEIERTVEQLSSGLSTQFAKWIRSIDVTQATGGRLKLGIPNSAFLNFNYTGTLGCLYGIPPERVFHIHGSAGIVDDNLILGHAWHPATRPSLNDYEGVEDSDVRVYQANDIIDGYFASTFKPASEILKQHAQFFVDLLNVKEVLVLGHSLSEVDAEYLRAIRMSCEKSTRWHLASRDPATENARINTLRSLGVEQHQIHLTPWDQF